MVKMKYVGPGASEDKPKVIDVQEGEVQPLERTKLWQKMTKKKSSTTSDKKEGE